MIPHAIKTIIDLTMGDGYIGIEKGRNNARMRIEHSIKQKQYAQHKQHLLESLGLCLTAKEITIANGKNTGKQYYRIDVHQSPLLTTAYKWTYNKGKKSIDRALLRQLDDRSLAYWFMDDGCAKLVQYIQKPNVRYVYVTPKIAAFKFSNQSFSYEENMLFVEWLKTMHVQAHITTNNGFEVMITDIENKQRFLQVIEPHIIPSMMYKIQYPLSFQGMDYSIISR